MYSPLRLGVRKQKPTRSLTLPFLLHSKEISPWRLDYACIESYQCKNPVVHIGHLNCSPEEYGKVLDGLYEANDPFRYISKDFRMTKAVRGPNLIKTAL